MAKDERTRQMQGDENMAQFFKELIPYIDGMEKLLAKYVGEHTLDVNVCSDGFVKAHVYGSGYDLTKYHHDPTYKIQKEYKLFEECAEEVG